MTQSVPDELRDKIMETILANPQNRLCFDCGSKEPKWSSPYLGIIVCYECAARHRSYGAHISFIRSIDLDKWNKKQLKSLQITGNEYTREKFIEMGIPKKGTIYDYESDLILKFRANLAEQVKELLSQGSAFGEGDDTSKNKNADKEGNKNENEFSKVKEEVHIENEVNKEEIKEEKEEPKPEIKEPTKFEIKQKAKVTNIKVEGKAGKKNKIKKVDFDFDFDSFNDMNFSDFNQNESNNDANNNDNNDNSPKDYDLKYKSKDNDDDDDFSNKKDNYYSRGYDIKLSQEEINKKLANKKAISSADYEALENMSSDDYYSNKLKSMGNSQAISSSDLFGTPDNSYYQGESFGDKMKDFAINFTLKAAEKAKELKNKTNEMINRVQNKFGGSGY